MAMKILESEFSVAKPYARGVVAGNFVFLSGVGGIDPATDAVLSTMEEQAEMICRRIKAALKAAGTSTENIVKSLIYVTDVKSYKEQGAPIIRRHLPVRASALLGVKELGRQGMMLQVEVTALLRS